MPTELQQLRLSSFNVDIPPAEVPINEWNGFGPAENGGNVLFRDGYATRAAGWTKIFPPLTGAPFPGATEPQFLLNTQEGVQNYWLCGTDNGIFVTDTVNWFDVSPSSFVPAQNPQDWSGDLVNGIPVLNNGAGPPVYWTLDTGSPMQDLPDWPANTLCKYIVSSKFHLFALNITAGGNEFPDQLYWSDAAEPGAVPAGWTPTATGDAGDNILAADRSPIISARELRGSLAIYKSNATYIANYVGGSFVWSFRKLLSNSGILGPHCVTSIPSGRHVVLTDGDLIVHDGQNVESIIDKRVKRTFFELIDPDNFNRAHVVNNTAQNEVIVAFIRKDQEYSDFALVWDYARNHLGVRELPDSIYLAQGIVTEAAYDPSWDGADSVAPSWNTYPGPWNASFYSAADDGVLICPPDANQVYYLDGSTTLQDGNDFTSQIERTHVDFEDPYRKKLLRAIWPRVTAPAGVQMEVRAAGTDFTDETIPWSPSDWKPFDPNGQQKVDLFVEGRFLHFGFRSTSGDKWTLEGFDVDVIPGGFY